MEDRDHLDLISLDNVDSSLVSHNQVLGRVGGGLNDYRVKSLDSFEEFKVFPLGCLSRHQSPAILLLLECQQQPQCQVPCPIKNPTAGQ